MERYIVEALADDPESAEEVSVELPEELVEEIESYLVEHPRWSRERVIREALQQQVYRDEE